jgi:TfoX/Sxy family transcriptional regulator of competence genes
MAWAKSSPRLIAAFDALVPPAPAERKKMFGYPCAFVNGQLFMGLWQEEMMLRLAEGERVAMERIGGKPFEPMPGKPMREYVSVPAGMVYDPVRLKPWVEKSLAFALSLPPKAASKKKAAKGGATKPAKKAAAAAKPGAGKGAKAAAAKGKKAAKGRPRAAKSGANSRSRARPRTGR